MDAAGAKHSMATNHMQQEDEPLIAFPYLFARQLEKTPDNLAIVFEEREYSYRELDQLSEQFKHAVMLQTGANKTRGVCIGICIDKSPEAIAAMLGILKAGAAFVPLDPEYPAERIAYMVEDADISSIIAQPDHQQYLSPMINKTGLVWIDCYQPTDDKTVFIDKQPEIKPDDLAYIMYTSGSTGKPKGVQIEHAALATYCFADIDVYKVEEADRTLQFSTINFDIAIEEIFPPLLTGSCVVVRPAKRSQSLNELSTIINDYGVTAVHIATAYWHEWVDLMVASADTIPASLRLMVVTGEKVSTKHYQHWKTLCEKTGMEVLWCNAYGPTEATVSASVFIPDEQFNEDNMPIGKPLKRYSAMIVDANYNDLPAGETGQLLIGGPALARGYLNRPELNAEVFVDVKTTESTQRMYKTGDLARWRENGDIEFAGRIDHQIKLGSYRIEPGEIEVAINQHQDVLESLVSYDEVDGKKALIAYIAHGDNDLQAGQLSEFLKQHLPAYMVPARFVLLPAFPKTTNGKIDRKALPDPASSEVARASGYIAPRNELEQKLARMWQEVLRIPEAGIHDDFFALGGSSLLAVGVVSRLINELDLELPVRDFFANPTIASQAKHIQRMLNNVETTEADSDDDSRALRERLPIVKPAFFDNQNGQQLYGILYQVPRVGAEKSRKHGVLMCHPLGHEYPRSYRNLQQLAIQLAQSGFDILRFDYYGTGNSQGDSEHVTAGQCASDIRSAAGYLREQSQCERLSVIGVRLGVPFAVEAKLDDLENLIAWDPVMNGKQYIEMLEKLHSKELTALSSFRQVRQRSDIDQLYGHAYSQEKRHSLNQVRLPLEAPGNSRNCYLLTSENYLANEPGCEQLATRWQHIATQDQIYWHDQNYTDSAFSSPGIFQHILSILKKAAN